MELARHVTNDIDGWISDGEGGALYDLASIVPREQAIVEIRSWRGKSTVWLAMGASAGNGSRVYSIDPQGEEESALDADLEQRYPIMIENLTNAVVRDRVTILPWSPEVAVHRRRISTGLLWIDAFQEYDAIKGAFAAWKPRLMPGAMVAVNDCEQSEPLRFVEECLAQSSEFSIIRTVDTMVLAQYDTCVHHWLLDSADSGICRQCGRTRSFRMPRQQQRRVTHAGN